jgi:hypothetical protein
MPTLAEKLQAKGWTARAVHVRGPNRPIQIGTISHNRYVAGGVKGAENCR